MESAFGRLFRTSKLASFDRGVKQVYATHPDAFVKGDWGLKRKMPPNVYTRLITLDSLDTKEQIVKFDSANQQYMLTNTWKENFPDSSSPEHSKSVSKTGLFAGRHSGEYTESDSTASPKGPQRNLVVMSREEWKQFLAEARARRSEWKHALEEGHYAPEETLAFMNVTNLRDSHNDGVHRSPTYHNYVATSEELQVRGRVLNRTSVGYAVAVQGIIAHLPFNSHKHEIGFSYRNLKTFYVHSATFDGQGRPEVVLGIRPRGAHESFSIDSNTRGSFGFKKSGLDNSLKSEFLDKIKGHFKPRFSAKEAKPGDDAVSEALNYINQNSYKQK
ncbi:hypothetical protein FB645_000810 [Coemansia sp. IMI 203386]|nr:hypothetical protein FB645_000810 [Coemansia sp. IMI 203386]